MSSPPKVNVTRPKRPIDGFHSGEPSPSLASIRSAVTAPVQATRTGCCNAGCWRCRSSYAFSAHVPDPVPLLARAQWPAACGRPSPDEYESPAASQLTGTARSAAPGRAATAQAPGSIPA